jgi:HSP20 family protein
LDLWLNFAWQLAPVNVNTLYYVHKSTTGTRRRAAGETHWIPNTDVYVVDKELVIKVELAGMHREDLELTVEGNRLMISGHRPDDSRPCKCKFLVMEINYGHFECVIEVPEGYELTAARAVYQNGFLQINVPQAVRAAPPKGVLVPIAEE